MAIYLSSYAANLSTGLPQTNVAVALALALALFALLVVLGVTSFNVVKKRMKKETWKRVQLLAYPFWGLVYVHLLLMLVPSALRGGAPAQMAVVVTRWCSWATPSFASAAPRSTAARRSPGA